MADACANFAIRNIPLVAGGWTPLVAPIECSALGMRSKNGNPLRVRTDADDAITEDTLPGGVQELIVAPGPQGCTRFSCDGIVLFVQPTGDADDVAVVRFVR